MSENIFCCNCGKQISRTAKVCVGCGVEAGQGEKFCPNCGKERTTPLQSVCLGCGSEFKKFIYEMRLPAKGGKEWVIAALFSYFLGWLGIDRFYLGYITLGIIKLLTCGGCGVWYLIDCILIIFNKIPDASGEYLPGREGKEWIGYVLLGIMALGFVGGGLVALRFVEVSKIVIGKIF
ncbi:MAG: NINE protein [Planctomycetota bacterium]